MSATDRKIRTPMVNPETKPYWEAAGRGVLLYKKCEACNEPHFYPRSFCPFCFSDKTVWKEASGKAVIYSYSVMRRAPVPYAIAFVTLEEGPTIMTNLVDCDLNGLKIGQKVKLVYKPSEDGSPVPMFTPA